MTDCEDKYIWDGFVEIHTGMFTDWIQVFEWSTEDCYPSQGLLVHPNTKFLGFARFMERRR